MKRLVILVLLLNKPIFAFSSPLKTNSMGYQSLYLASVSEDPIESLEETNDILPNNLNLVEKSKWQLGLGTFLAYYPHYPSSNHYYLKYFIVPIYKYRTKNFDLEGSTYSGKPKGKLQTSVSLGARFPVSNSSNAAKEVNQKESEGNNIVIQKDNYHRRGMDELGLVIKLGLSVSYFFNDHVEGSIKTFTNISVVNELSLQGNEINPQIEFSYFERESDFNIFAKAKVSYGDKKLNNYYYGVADHEVLPDRHSYQATAGEIGRTFAIKIKYKKDDVFQIFSAYSWAFYSNSINSQSPLFILDKQETFAIGFLYYFYSSKKKISTSM